VATEEELTVKITITTSNNLLTKIFYVNANDKISTLINKLQEKRGPPAEGKAFCLTKTPSWPSPEEQRMMRESTFLENYFWWSKHHNVLVDFKKLKWLGNTRSLNLCQGKILKY